MVVNKLFVSGKFAEPALTKQVVQLQTELEQLMAE